MRPPGRAPRTMTAFRLETPEGQRAFGVGSSEYAFSPDGVSCWPATAWHAGTMGSSGCRARPTVAPRHAGRDGPAPIPNRRAACCAAHACWVAAASRSSNLLRTRGVIVHGREFITSIVGGPVSCGSPHNQAAVGPRT